MSEGRGEGPVEPDLYECDGGNPGNCETADQDGLRFLPVIREEKELGYYVTTRGLCPRCP